MRRGDGKSSLIAKTREPNGPSGAGVTSLKVTLRYTQPPVWRRVLMPGTMTLKDLHHSIQAVMGWDDSHLHVFEVDGQRYGPCDIVDDVNDETGLTLNDLVKSGADRFSYTYDFGDDWEHLIVVEKSKLHTDGKPYPVCVAGKRNCPPDDCGGTPGYECLLEILADSAHPEHAESVEWLGEAFDPEEFDIGNANAVLPAHFRQQ